MTGAELRQWLRDNETNVTRLAGALGVHRTTVHRWLHTGTTGLVDVAIRSLAAPRSD
jgi:DNA-binding IclR family transcriptional regulator